MILIGFNFGLIQFPFSGTFYQLWFYLTFFTAKKDLLILETPSTNFHFLQIILIVFLSSKIKLDSAHLDFFISLQKHLTFLSPIKT